MNRPDDYLDLIARYQPMVAAFFALGFVVIYQVKGKWWKSAIGRHMMSFMLGCFIVLMLAITVRYFPWLPIKWIRFFAWNIVIFLMAWRFWIAWQILVRKKYPDINNGH